MLYAGRSGLRSNEWNLNIAPLPKTAEDYYYDGIRASFAEYGVESKYGEYITQNGVKWGTDSDDDKCLREYHGYFRAHIYGKSGGQTHRGDPADLDNFTNPRAYPGNYTAVAALPGDWNRFGNSGILRIFGMVMRAGCLNTVHAS